MTWKDTYQEWLNQDQLEPALKEQLVAMDDDQEKEDAFYGPLSFGTAGMRGLMGPGINRMNVYTVRQATAGLAKLMTSLGEETMARGVAISYDSRNNSRLFCPRSSPRVLGARDQDLTFMTTCAQRQNCPLPSGTCTPTPGS